MCDQDWFFYFGDMPFGSVMSSMLWKKYHKIRVCPDRKVGPGHGVPNWQRNLQYSVHWHRNIPIIITFGLRHSHVYTGVPDRRVGCCLGPERNGVNPGREGPAPQKGSEISSQLPARKEATVTWSRRKKERRVRHDEEDPACTEWAFFTDLCLYVYILLSYHTYQNQCHICFRRINHMAINHLHSSSDAMSFYVTVTSGTTGIVMRSAYVFFFHVM